MAEVLVLEERVMKAMFGGSSSCSEGRKAGPRRRREEVLDTARPDKRASRLESRSEMPSTGRGTQG